MTTSKCKCSFPYPKLISHRGASHYAPENTIAAFKLAKEMGAEAIETDVMLTSDGIPIIMHDNSAKRTTGKAYQIGQTPWSDLIGLNAGDWKRIVPYRHETIPTLVDLLNTMNETGLAANIEIKPYESKQFTAEQQRAVSRKTAEVTLQQVREFYKEHPNMPGIVYSSFDVDALRALREADCEWPIGLLLDKWPKDSEALMSELQPASVHMNSRLASESRVHRLKQRGYKVLVYTVNTAKRAKELFKRGVDGIFTNKPNLLKRK